MFASQTGYGMKLYIFNPDTDLALAYGGEVYIAPASARLMARDLAALPMWYASEDGVVWLPPYYDTDYVEKMAKMFGLKARWTTQPDMQVDAVVPWGWNLALRRHLLKSGIQESCLPSVDELAGYRRMASREEVSALLRDYACGEDYCGESHNLYSLQACRDYVEGHKCTLLKAPWSGSGKGLRWGRGVFGPALAGWCVKVLKGQGCVAASPVYDKVADFAMEYVSHGDGTATFVGYSSFTTSGTGVYAGNCLMPAELFEERMAAYVGRERLRRLHVTAQGIARHYASAYTGPLGIDMMVCRDEARVGHYLIHPCVEVNLRMNMGLLACKLQRRIMAPGVIGQFAIECFPVEGDLLHRHEADMVEHPLRVSHGRLLSGYLPLVPVCRESRYRAYVMAGRGDWPTWPGREDSHCRTCP